MAAMRGRACDVVFMVSSPDLKGIKGALGDYAATGVFAERYRDLAVGTVRFNDPSTRVVVDGERFVIAQQGQDPVDIMESRAFVYLPASFEPEEVALRPVDTHDPDGLYHHRQWRVVAERLEQLVPTLGPCINDPTRARAGCNKLIHQAAIRAAGAGLPPTVVSNDADDTAAVLEGGRAIVKYLSETGRPNGSTPTTLLTPAMVADAEARKAPLIYQRYVDAVHELRIYVMDDEVTAVTIRTENREALPDMRYRTFTSQDFAITEAYRAQDPLLRRTARALRLRYAVFDAFPAEGGGMTLSELNVNGIWSQWEEPIKSTVRDRFHAFVHRVATTEARARRRA